MCHGRFSHSASTPINSWSQVQIIEILDWLTNKSKLFSKWVINAWNSLPVTIVDFRSLSWLKCSLFKVYFTSFMKRFWYSYVPFSAKLCLSVCCWGGSKCCLFLVRHSLYLVMHYFYIPCHFEQIYVCMYLINFRISMTTLCPFTAFLEFMGTYRGVIYRRFSTMLTFKYHFPLTPRTMLDSKKNEQKRKFLLFLKGLML